MAFTFNDGGGATAGYQGHAGDSICRSIAIAASLPYREVYDGLNKAAKPGRRGRRKRGKSSARTGIHKATVRKYLASLGWEWVPTMGIGTGCLVHLHADELPSGRLIVSLTRHVTAVIDGVIHDTHDPSRDGTRCVYGYWHKEPLASHRRVTALPHQTPRPAS